MRNPADKKEKLTMQLAFQPKQDDLYQLYQFGTATKIGAGGSRGGSKSASADLIMFLRRLTYAGTSGLFVMKVYQDMLDIHIRPLIVKYPVLDDMFNRQDMIISLPNGSFIRFLSGDRLEEFQKRKGREFADIVVDQSELFTQDELEFLYTINRSTNPKITAKTLLCFNPGGVSHSYHKRIFIEKRYENREIPEEFAFVQMFGWDNAYWSLKNLLAEGLTIEQYHTWPAQKRFDYFIKTDYGQILDRLPENKRKAELLGDFDIFEGMFFSDFRWGHHVLENYKRKAAFNTVGGLDYGRTTVLEILQRDYEGTIVCCGEVYLPDMESPSERANAIADYLIANELYRLTIIYDTDMDISQISNVGFDKRPVDIFREIFRQRMGDNAPYMEVVNKISLDRNRGFRAVCNEAVKEYLHIKKVTVEGREIEKSGVYFSKNCTALIDCITTLIFDPKDKTGADFDRSANPKTDHPYDAFKMGFMKIYTPLLKKESLLPKWAQEEFDIEEDEDDERVYERRFKNVW
jgi:phage terminase large subunit